MPTLYVLLCEDNRYYVGKTERPITDRVEEHFYSNGSEWTRRYKPIKVVEQVPNADEFDEDKYTKKYMTKYGIDKVRGGAYTQIELPNYAILSLEKELCSASNLCFRCKRSGHFAGACYASTTADGSPIHDDRNNTFMSRYEAHKQEKACNGISKSAPLFLKVCDAALKIAVQFLGKEKPSNGLCFRCGRYGHYANTCFSLFHMNGKKL